MRRIFKSRFNTELIEEKIILISVAPKDVAAKHGSNGQPIAANQWGGRTGGKGQTKGKVGWNELGGEHLHFTLYKENKDTMEVLSMLTLDFPLKQYTASLFDLICFIEVLGCWLYTLDALG